MRVLLLLFVTVAFFGMGDGLKCYDGIGPVGSPTVHVVDCPPGKLFCLKAHSHLNEVAARMCAREIPPRDPNGEVYSCTTDLCNGVTATSATIWTLMLLVVPFLYTNGH